MNYSTKDGDIFIKATHQQTKMMVEINEVRDRRN